MPDAPPTADALAELRAEIDALDDALHGLLMRRAEVVARLAASAAKPAGTVLRPGREAAILRRLLARHAGPMPPGAVVRVWRELFAASIAQQAEFVVAVAGGSGVAALAAQHFGAATPLAPHPSPEAALAALAAGRAAVAVLPFPGTWWAGLEAAEVIARLPFWSEGAPAAEAAVVARYAADPSGADIGLFRCARPAPGLAVLAEDAATGLALVAAPPGAPPPGAHPIGRHALPLRGTGSP